MSVMTVSRGAPVPGAKRPSSRQAPRRIQIPGRRDPFRFALGLEFQ